MIRLRIYIYTPYKAEVYELMYIPFIENIGKNLSRCVRYFPRNTAKFSHFRENQGLPRQTAIFCIFRDIPRFPVRF